MNKSRSKLHSIFQAVSSAANSNLIHLRTTDKKYNGRHINVSKTKMIHFGSCSYLGLDVDKRLKEGAIQATRKYGVQFSSSRSYLSCTLYEEWEELLSKIFGFKPLLFTSVSLGHQSVIPVLIETGDVIIMDQQVHASVQDVIPKLKSNDHLISVIRHNDLNRLEEHLQSHSSTGNRVWYFLDGVYSMHGDLAPIEQLEKLLDSYPHLHLYIDDAHGMSISGKYGAGMTLSRMKFHPRMVLATSLNKAFGAGGGAFIFPNEEWYEKAHHCAGSYIFSGGHQIPVIGAGIASSKIHLSNEIVQRQDQLKANINYCAHLLENSILPHIVSKESPIFFIATGLPSFCYKLVGKMHESACFVNPAIFPVVNSNQTGLRFTLTTHHTQNDIEHLINRLEFHWSTICLQDQISPEQIAQYFRRVKTFVYPKLTVNSSFIRPTEQLIMKKASNISQLDTAEWDLLLGNKSTFDSNGLSFLEQTFAGNKSKENNWKFIYYVIRDENETPILITYFTFSLIKDDMLASKSKSYKIESTYREDNPYYLSSKCAMMGCPISAGNHLYLDTKSSHWEKALNLVLNEMKQRLNSAEIDLILLRDFEKKTPHLSDFFQKNGFIEIELPSNHKLITKWENPSDYLNQLSKKKRYNLKREVTQLEEIFLVKILDKAPPLSVDHYYELYSNVTTKSYEINSFKLPKKFFSNLLLDNQWEIIELRISTFDKPIGIACCYKNKYEYGFQVVGMDYNYLESHNLYKQIIWQVVKRANQLGLPSLNLGLTASISKRKFGASPIELVAYSQVNDSYNQQLIQQVF